MIIDIHGHLGNINFAPFWQADAAKLESYCAEAGVNRLCVSSSRSLMYDVFEGNAELNKALMETEKLYGYAVVNPVFPESIREVKYLKSNPKFRGLKIHPDYHGYDIRSKRMTDFLDEAADSTRLMLCHVSCMPGTGFADAVKTAEFAARHPKTNFVFAHIAGIFQNSNYPYYPNLDNLECIMAMKLNNIYIDTAHYLMYVYPGVMEKVVELAGVDHVVFGTDVPLQGPMQMRFAIETIQALPMKKSDRDKILGGNAERLLK